MVGDITLSIGASTGTFKRGDVNIGAGSSTQLTGGIVSICSGESTEETSGTVLISTSNGGIVAPTDLIFEETDPGGDVN